MSVLVILDASAVLFLVRPWLEICVHDFVVFDASYRVCMCPESLGVFLLRFGPLRLWIRMYVWDSLSCMSRIFIEYAPFGMSLHVSLMLDASISFSCISWFICMTAVVCALYSHPRGFHMHPWLLFDVHIILGHPRLQMRPLLSMCPCCFHMCPWVWVGLRLHRVPGIQ